MLLCTMKPPELECEQKWGGLMAKGSHCGLVSSGQALLRVSSPSSVPWKCRCPCGLLGLVSF